MKLFWLVLLVPLYFSNLLASDKLAQMHATILSVNQKEYLAIALKNQQDWHTYWINPGEAGLATKLEFFLTKNKSEIKIAEDKIERPAPVKFSEGGNSEVVIYGHQNEHIFYYDLADFKKYNNQEILVRGTWLICKEICVNEQNELTFKLNKNEITITSPQTFTLTSGEYSSHFSKHLPIKGITLPEELTLYLAAFPETKKLHLNYQYSFKEGTNVNKLQEFFKHNNLIYPYPLVPFGFKREKLYVDKNHPNVLFGQVEIDWDGEYQDPPVTIPLTGKFMAPYRLKFLLNPIEAKGEEFEIKQAQILEIPLENFSLNPSEALISSLTPIDQTAAITSTEKAKPEYSIFIYYLLALLGGFILNFMPCVLPVISLKLFELIRSAGNADREKAKKRIFEHNLFYSIGIISCFMVLATIVATLKQQGESASWGFQLQNPYFVTCMIFILFIFSLNLFGLFEFRTPFGNKLGNVKIPTHIGGDFLGGVLTTVLSTPCSAPFLGSALTFAFFSPVIHIFGIFFTIGIGLAFPFLLTGIFPKLVSLLPRPGKWMLLIKKIMGVSLILTAIWLLDVLSSLITDRTFYITLVGSLTLILLLFLLKAKWLKVLFFFLVIGTTTLTFTQIFKRTANSIANDLIESKKAQGLNWEKWSVEKMDEYKKSGDLVFVDFTAKWCFNCKINEKLVLETPAFKKLVSEHNIKLLLADWTNHDNKISDFLNSFKIVGVPAYFVQKKDGTVISLGETITVNKIAESLKAK